MTQVSQGEVLAAAGRIIVINGNTSALSIATILLRIIDNDYLIGPSKYDEAACCFYRALKVYPNPIELVMIYQKTVPDVIFSLVMAMMAQEVFTLTYIYKFF